MPPIDLQSFSISALLNGQKQPFFAKTYPLGPLTVPLPIREIR